MKPIFLLLGFLVICQNEYAQQNSSMMEQKISFITLGVKDLETSIDFYENKLGWKRSEMSNGDMIVFEVSGIHFSLYPREELAKDAMVDATGEGFRGFTISQNVKSEKEVDDLIETLRKVGVKIVKEPQKVFWGGYSSYIADPDGNLWEIAYNPFL